MHPDDDKQYAIETCRSSESVLKKLFKNKLHTISAFVGYGMFMKFDTCVFFENLSIKFLFH